MSDVLAPATPAIRTVGTSNLAQTIRNHRKNYKAAAKPDGRKTQNNGDPIATALLGIPLDVLKAFSALRFDGKRYDHLNPGHARMCIGNNIRAEVKKHGDSILEALLTA